MLRLRVITIRGMVRWRNVGRMTVVAVRIRWRILRIVRIAMVRRMVLIGGRVAAVRGRRRLRAWEALVCYTVVRDASRDVATSRRQRVVAGTVRVGRRIGGTRITLGTVGRSTVYRGTRRTRSRRLVTELGARIATGRMMH